MVSLSPLQVLGNTFHTPAAAGQVALQGDLATIRGLKKIIKIGYTI
jgi:hypothetical protein